MIGVETIRWRGRTGTNAAGGSVRLEHRSSSIQLGGKRIPSLVVELTHLIAVFLFGAACSQLTTDIGKYTIGRLRPHFLSVCFPDARDLAKYCSANSDPHLYVMDYTCTQDDDAKMKDARLSFPSGHASFSAYTLLYLALYLQQRMTWSGSRLIRPTYQIALLMLSWYTGLSRVTDFKHHW